MDSREEQDRSGGLSGRVVDRTSGRDKQSYSEDDDEYDNDITLVDIPPQLAKSGGKGGNAVGTGTEAEHGGGAREGERGRSNKRKAPVIDDLDIRPARMPHPSRNVKSNDNGDVNHSPVPSLAPTLPPISSIMNMPGMAYSRAPPFALTPSSAPACSTPIRPVPLTPGIPSSASTSTSASAPTHAYAYDPLTPPTARSLGLNGPPPLGSARLLDKLRKEEERGGRSRSLPSSSPLKTSRWASQEGHEHPFLSSPPISSETSRQPAVSPSSRYPQPGRPTPTSSAAAQGGPERLPPLPSPTHGPSSRLAASYRNDHHSGRSTNVAIPASEKPERRHLNCGSLDHSQYSPSPAVRPISPQRKTALATAPTARPPGLAATHSDSSSVPAKQQPQWREHVLGLLRADNIVVDHTPAKNPGRTQNASHALNQNHSPVHARSEQPFSFVDPGAFCDVDVLRLMIRERDKAIFEMHAKGAELAGEVDRLKAVLIQQQQQQQRWRDGPEAVGANPKKGSASTQPARTYRTSAPVRPGEEWRIGRSAAEQAELEKMIKAGTYVPPGPGAYSRHRTGMTPQSASSAQLSTANTATGTGTGVSGVVPKPSPLIRQSPSFSTTAIDSPSAARCTHPNADAPKHARESSDASSAAHHLAPLHLDPPGVQRAQQSMQRQHRPPPLCLHRSTSRSRDRSTG